MIFELLINPITSSKKLVNKLNNKVLIIFSVCIHLLIAALPAFFIMQFIKNLYNEVMGSMANLFQSNNNNNNFSSSIGNSIFIFIFERVLIAAIVISVVIFIVLFIYFKLRKTVVTPLLIWKAMTISGIQIIYYLILATILGFLSVYLYIIAIIGIFNSVICLYSLFTETNTHTVSIPESTYEIESETSSQIASSVAANLPLLENNISEKNSVSFIERLKTINKRNKTILISSLAAIVVIVALLAVGNYATSEATVCSKLNDAIKNYNSSELANYVTCSDPRLVVNEDSLKPFIQYLKDNPSYTSEILSSINSQANSNSSSTGDFKLISNGKKYLFFPNYVLQLPACFVTITTDSKNTVVSLNNKALYTASSDDYSKQCGPFLPGSYEFTASLKTDYASAKGHVDVILSNENYNSNDVNLPLDGKKLNIYSNFEDSEIIINGKDTGVEVKNINALMPIPTDGSCKVNLQRKFPWGNMTTNEVVVSDNMDSLDFDKNNSSLLDNLKPSIIAFINSYISAYDALDPSKVSNATSNFIQNATNDINNDKSFNTTYSGSYTDATIDLSSLSLNYDSSSDSYSVYVNMNLSGNFTSNFGGSSNNSYEMKLIYDTKSNKWLVDGFDSTWMSNTIQNGNDVKLK